MTSGAATIGGMGRHIPQHFGWVDAKVKIKGVLYYQNSIFSASATGPRWGLRSQKILQLFYNV